MDGFSLKLKLVRRRTWIYDALHSQGSEKETSVHCFS